MDRLASGDFDAAVEGAERRDEVGLVAKTVLVFKENGLEMRRLEAQGAEHERAGAVICVRRSASAPKGQVEVG